MITWAKINLTAPCVAAAVLLSVTGGPVATRAVAQEKQAQQHVIGAPVDWGKPVVSDDFGRAQLGNENWEMPKGSAEIKDGKLVVTSKRTFYLLYNKKLASNMAIEFDGMIPDTKKACDLTAILSGDENEPTTRHYTATRPRSR